MYTRETFGYAGACRMAGELVTRLSGEPIDAYLARREETACKLLIASTEQGTPLQRYLTVGHLNTPPELRDRALRTAASASLPANAPEASTSLSLVPLASAASVSRDQFVMRLG